MAWRYGWADSRHGSNQAAVGIEKAAWPGAQRVRGSAAFDSSKRRPTFSLS